ncbi:MAG: SDR family NAD(P)-dependent oxidoreductase [Planctomycetota bacterium]
MTAITDGLGLKDKHCVVTGGTGGLGAAVVSRLVEAGANVTVPVFHHHEMSDYDWCDADCVRCVEGVDLTEPVRCQTFYARAVAERGPLWASIHVAGGFSMGGIDATDPEVFDKMMAMNAKTCYLSCLEAARHMKHNEPSEFGRGRILNVTARVALVREAGANMVAYSASKGAVASITQSLGSELANDDIWVNAIAPSVVDTAANREAMPDADHDAWPKPDEIAETIAFLVSPANRATRGALVPVYGRS